MPRKSSTATLGTRDAENAPAPAKSSGTTRRSSSAGRGSGEASSSGAGGGRGGAGASRATAELPGTRGTELLGLLVLSATALMAVALGAHHLHAPGASSATHLMGSLGEGLALRLDGWVGWLGYVFAAGLAVLGLSLVLGRRLRVGAFEGTGYLLVCLAATLVLHLYGGPRRLGGDFGQLVGARSLSLIGVVGSWLLALFILAAGMVLTTGLSLGAGLSRVFGAVGSASRVGGQVMTDIALDVRDQWAQRRQEREELRREREARMAPRIVITDDVAYEPEPELPADPEPAMAPEATPLSVQAALADLPPTTRRKRRERPSATTAAAPETAARTAAVPVEIIAPAPPAPPPPVTSVAPVAAAFDDEDEPAPTPAAATEPASPPPTIVEAPVRARPQLPPPAARPAPASAPVAREAAEARPRAPRDPVPTHMAYELPGLNLLDYHEVAKSELDREAMMQSARRLERTLADYGVGGRVTEIRPGPVITLYEFQPAPGVKLSKIASLSNDLAMALEAVRVRILAPIPGKNCVGFEVPNRSRETVFVQEIFADDAFQKHPSRLCLALGKDIAGRPQVADFAKMPHLLVAGATGAGKSVSVNAMICSLLYKATPAEVRMILVDPKMLELSVYDGIPHLLLPVVTDPKKAALALRWAVDEMARRYEMLAAAGVRNISGFNTWVRQGGQWTEKATKNNDRDPPKELPYIVVVVDELADLMMIASKEVEACIQRLAQMARAAGIHLLLATQRPSTDVITGVIKANFPTRIAFQVSSNYDSQTIIGRPGAENLLGQGDMLYLSAGGNIERVHGAYVTDDEVKRVVEYWQTQGQPVYDENILKPREEEAEGGVPEEDFSDENYDAAVALVCETRQASISMVQRRLRVGYNRAARMIERMEKEGIVGPAEGSRPREVIASAPP